MPDVQNVLTFLQQLAPPSLAEDWDNVGLLCGSRNQPVSKILVALDPFLPVCQEAADLGADLIVTHHPLIFRPLKSVTDDSEPGACAITLIQHGISAINAHTNLDMAAQGVNQVLAERLGLTDIQVPEPVGADENGNLQGLLRTGITAPADLETFLSEVKLRLGTPVLRYVSGGKQVHKVAVGGGACGSEMGAVIRAGCDTFITSDLKYNQFRDAAYAGLNLIDAGHFYTENPVVPILAGMLRKKFPEIQVEISKVHCDCMKFF